MPRKANVDMDLSESSSGPDKRKQSLYLGEELLQQLKEEAARLDRSLSWLVQRCCKIGLAEIRKLPSVSDPEEG